ncbi:MAG: hypothetical protein IKQ92_13990 [Clostridia bacterium]|nr:hypothetical protein [Clostridia bacterium]
MPEIDITHIPFSRYGAYVAVTRDKIPGGTEYAKVLTIHTVRRRFEEGALFTLSFGAEEPEDFEVSAVPEAITVSNEHGKARIYIRDDNTVTVDSRGLDLCIRLRSFGYGTEMAEGSFRMIAPHLSLIATVAAPMGEAFTDGPVQGQKWGERDYKTAVRVRCKDGAAQLALMIRPCEPGKITLPLCPEEEIAQIRAEWEEFLAFMPDLPAADAETENFNLVTWYNLFSSFVRAEGDYKNDTMLMSKKTMSSTWSWDHCFNALAMAEMKTLESDPDRRARVALGQFSAPFYLQTPLGVLPDMWNPGLETRWGTMKPPIHGWCFEKLMDRFWIDRDTLTEIYFWLEKWTNWWMKECDTDGDGIPDYPQGCDSGWDNSTLFDIGYYLESPDLPAFLILQMRALAHLADKLTAWPVVTGKPWEARRDEWLAEADALLERFLAHSWNGERFVAKLSGSHRYEEEPTSLLSLMPLVLGDLLPKEIRDKLAAVLERDFLTENGFATEMPASPKYESDGYWRGPIWAPSTYLLVDGLRRGGYHELAEKAARRYTEMSCRKAKGNYENFDALTGKGWRAPGYTWSASVYLLLQKEFG